MTQEERTPPSWKRRMADLWVWGRPPFSRADAVLMVLLAAVSCALAWPGRARYLTEWDSSLFALATERYDFLAGQPHPPGYPVFVFLAKIARVVVPEANAAIVGVSMLCGAAMVALLYGLVREFTGRSPAVAVSLLFAFSPNLLFNQAVALSYTAEGLASVGIAWVALRAHASDGRTTLRLLSCVFALGVGLRPSIAIYLSPLVAWAILHGRPERRDALLRLLDASATGLLAGLAWWIPMVAAGRGPTAWWQTSRYQSRIVIFESTVFNHGLAAVRDHVGRIRFFLRAEDAALALMGAAAFALVVLLVRAQWRRELLAPARQVATFLCLWAMPSLVFMALIFSGWLEGPRGYVLVFLPAFYAAVAIVAHAALPRFVPAGLGRARAWGLGAITLLLLVPAPELHEQADRILTKQVRDHDDWSESWLRLRDELPANETAIFTSYSWVFAKWYLPEYLVWGILRPPLDDGSGKWSLIEETRERHDDVPMYEAHLEGRGGPHHAIPAGIRRIVIFDFQLAGENEGVRFLDASVEVKEGRLADGWRYLYVETSPERPTIESFLSPEYRPV